MKSNLKEYNDDQLECIDNRMYIKSSKKLLTGIHVEYHKNGNVKCKMGFKDGDIHDILTGLKRLIFL